MRNRIATAATTVALAGLVAFATPAASQVERFTVPLTRPGQPVRVEVALVFGSIAVESHGSGEVIVEAQEGEERRAAAAPAGPAQGMRRLPNSSLGLVIEEEDNLVRVSSQGAPRRASLRLLVPRRASLELTTVNDGDISVRDVEGDLEVRNTNGSIRLQNVGGAVVAHTVNGKVEVTLTRLAPDAALSFATLNGNVDVTLPPTARGALRLRSDNGEIFTDFDVQLTPRPAQVEQERVGGRYRLEMQREVTGTIGGGGPEITVRTFNGNIYLRKGGG